MIDLSQQRGSLLSSFLALVGASDGDGHESDFVGTWLVQDSSGQPFTIRLEVSGAATANRAGEGMNGTWDLDGVSAVIAWDTGWTTKITRTEDGFTKTAYDSTAAAPTNTSAAEKIR
ncbi:MAG: hypothetical protein J0H65_07685 [Rhizobiales bacterium]|nr:hypothetical protein [Hyphomicrobiales bacterium]